MSVTHATAAKPAARPAASASSSVFLQRKCACGGTAGLTGDCEECKTSTRLGRPLQRKLAISVPGDEYEREADRVADEVMRIPEPASGQDAGEARGAPLVQRRVNGASVEGTAEAPPIVHEVLASSGQPLDARTRRLFEPRFGHDFGHVRVHADARAAESARSVSARAYTVGHHIVLGPAQPAPGTAEGQRLLAHEIVHTVQQSARAHQVVQRSSMAEETIQSFGGLSWLDYKGLGAVLKQKALEGDPAFVEEVLDSVRWDQTDNVAYEVVKACTDQELDELAGSSGGRRLMARMYDDVTSINVWSAEKAEADRLLAARGRQVSIETFEASTHTKVFPFVLPGYTKNATVSDVERRPDGMIWIRLYHGRVVTNPDYRDDVATLPSEVFTTGILVPEDEIIGVRMVDSGGELIYRPALIMVELSNTQDATILGKIVETSVAGFTMGSGALAGGAGKAGMLARTALWADRASFAIGIINSIIAEQRAWIQSRFGERGHTFLHWMDRVSSLVAIYDITRTAIDGLQTVNSLRRAFLDWRQAKAAASLSEDERRSAAELEHGLDAFLEVVDEVQAAHLPAKGRVGSGLDETVHEVSVAEAVPPREAALETARVEEPTPSSQPQAPRQTEVDLEAAVAISSGKPSIELSPQEKQLEADWVDRHPEVIEGAAPSREAQIGSTGKHKIVERVHGACARHSDTPVATVCPLAFLAPPGTSALYSGLEYRGLLAARARKRTPAATRAAGVEAQSRVRGQAAAMIEEARQTTVPSTRRTVMRDAPSPDRYDVYLFYDEDGTLLKVGQSLDLQSRIATNLKDELRGRRPAFVVLLGRQLNDVQAGALERAVNDLFDLRDATGKKLIAPNVPDEAVAWADSWVRDLNSTDFFDRSASAAPDGNSVDQARAMAASATNEPVPILGPDPSGDSPHQPRPGPGQWSIYAFYDKAGTLMKVGIAKAERLEERIEENLTGKGGAAAERVSKAFQHFPWQEGLIVPEGIRLQLIAEEVNSVQAQALEAAIGRHFVETVTGDFGSAERLGPELEEWADRTLVSLLEDDMFSFRRVEE